MSTVVFQGLQSYLETQFIETRTLRLKVASPIPEEINSTSNPELGGWSFLQALSNPSPIPKQSPSYDQPIVKRKWSTLSGTSLALCTENLGSETGTEMIESSILSLSSLPESNHRETTPARERTTTPRLKVNRCRDFPPPLTTISGSSSIRVTPHREGGRLVIQAVEASTTDSYLQAVRSNGRLRLCFWKDSNEENEGLNTEELENEPSVTEQEEEELECVEDEKDEGEEGELFEREDMDGNLLDVEVEMGMEKFRRPSMSCRCNEAGGRGIKALCNWEPFWVATS